MYGRRFMGMGAWSWQGLGAQLSLLYCTAQAMKASERDPERLGSALGT
jgi:hypothetical protein